MKKRINYVGLLMGSMLMVSSLGTGTVFAADKAAKDQTKTEAAAQAGTDSKEQKKDTKQDAGKEAKKEATVKYGVVRKNDKNKLTVDELEVIWEKDAKDTKDVKDAKDAKTTEKPVEEQANFETAFMKWKLNEKSMEINIDKDTKIMKETLAVQDEAAKKNEKKDEKKNADGKTEKSDEKKEDAVKTESIKIDDIKEINIVRVTLKDDGSMTASEIVLLSDAKEVKPTEKNDKTTQKDNKTSKEAGGVNTAKQADKKK